MTRYVEKKSIVHKINSTIKLLVLIVLSIVIFTIESYLYLSIIMGIVLVLIILSKIHIRYYLKNTKHAVYFILITFVMNMLILSNLSYSLMLSYRIFIMLALTQIFAITTTQAEVGRAITNILMPLKVFKVNIEEISIMIVIALSFMPILTRRI